MRLGGWKFVLISSDEPLKGSADDQLACCKTRAEAIPQSWAEQAYQGFAKQEPMSELLRDQIFLYLRLPGSSLGNGCSRSRRREHCAQRKAKEGSPPGHRNCGVCCSVAMTLCTYYSVLRTGRTHGPPGPGSWGLLDIIALAAAVAGWCDTEGKKKNQLGVYHCDLGRAPWCPWVISIV